MSASLLTSLLVTRANALNTSLGGSAVFKFYTGSAPANVGAAATGTLLVSCTANATAFGSVAGSGVLTASEDTASSGRVARGTAVASGTIGYCRIETSGGTEVIQLNSIGTSSGDIVLPSLEITTGEALEVKSFIWSEDNV